MFRFTIRDVLWLTVVVSLAVTAWMHYRGRLAAEVEYQRIRLLNQELAERNDRQRKILLAIPVTGRNWEQRGPVQ